MTHGTVPDVSEHLFFLWPVELVHAVVEFSENSRGSHANRASSSVELSQSRAQSLATVDISKVGKYHEVASFINEGLRLNTEESLRLALWLIDAILGRINDSELEFSSLMSGRIRIMTLLNELETRRYLDQYEESVRKLAVYAAANARNKSVPHDHAADFYRVFVIENRSRKEFSDMFLQVAKRGATFILTFKNDERYKGHVATIHLQIALAYVTLGQYPESLEYFELAESRLPGDFNIEITKVRAFYRLGRIEESKSRRRHDQAPSERCRRGISKEWFVLS